MCWSLAQVGNIGMFCNISMFSNSSILCNSRVWHKSVITILGCFAAIISLVFPTFAQSEVETQSRLEHKLKTVESGASQWVAAGRDPRVIGERVKHFEALMQHGQVREAEQVLDSVLVMLRNASAVAAKPAAESPVPIAFTDDVQYLIFMLCGPGIYEGSDSYAVIDKQVKELIEKVGTVGSGRRKLGFGILILPWMVEKAYPGKIAEVIHAAFRVAQSRHVSLFLSMDSHYSWDMRPDLWNCFDRHAPGYNPDNKNNVEWSSWQGSPYAHRYLDWGSPQEMAPPMCVNAPRIKAEVERLVMRVVAPPIREGLGSLKKAGEDNLFAGITVTSEPEIENYAIVDSVNPRLGEFMSKRGAPKLRLGFNALTQMGYCEKLPPKNIEEALAKVNQDFGAYWAEQFVKAGIPSSRLYTHVAASAGVPGTVACRFNNAPIAAAFNSYSRPGWTTYMAGPVQNDFGPIYKELAKHGNPHWGSSEASPSALGGPVVPTYEYLRRHYGHGATVMVMNTGATSSEAVQELERGVWGAQSITAYRRFLNERPGR